MQYKKGWKANLTNKTEKVLHDKRPFLKSQKTTDKWEKVFATYTTDKKANIPNT